jgi:hypothetical protein
MYKGHAYNVPLVAPCRPETCGPGRSAGICSGRWGWKRSRAWPWPPPAAPPHVGRTCPGRAAACGWCTWCRYRSDDQPPYRSYETRTPNFQIAWISEKCDKLRSGRHQHYTFLTVSFFLPPADSVAICQRPRNYFLTPPPYPVPPDFFKIG